MKKIFILMFTLVIGLMAFASDVENIKDFFNSYIESANSYSNNYFSYYSPHAIIKRVVIKKDGSTETVIVPLIEYKKHSALSVKLGKLRKYKNTYTDIDIKPEGEDYRINAMRKPSTSAYSLPVSFLIGKDSSGHLKIKEESMHTKVQTFLRKNR